MQQPPQPSVANVVPAQNMVIVEQQQQGDDVDRFTDSAKKHMKVLSCIQLVMSFLCIIFGIVLLAEFYNDTMHDSVAFMGYGIWIGIIWLVVGAVGLASTRGETNSCKIVAAMVLNIICASAFCYTMFGFSAAGISIADGGRRYCRRWSWDDEDCTSDTETTLELALNSLMLIMAFMQFVITIWCAVLCCGAVCRCCKGNRAQRVQYRHQMYGGAVYPAGVQFNPTVMQYNQSPYPVGVHQAGVMVQQPHMYYTAAAAYQHPPPQASGYNSQQAPAGGFQPQPVGYQPPPAYTQAMEGGQGQK